MRALRPLLLMAVAAAQACATAPTAVVADISLKGPASWYGEEFAGRTTANGEIFDPLLLTAAHRTLPFGTIVNVKNVKNGEAVAVRINDRGPFVGDRIINLSYAAALKIGMADAGSGTVELALVKLGKGNLEPPAPYVVSIPKPSEVVRDSAVPPPVAFPLPNAVETPGTPQSDNTFGVEVVEERSGVAVRKQVSASGRGIEEVPVASGAAGSAAASSPPPGSIRSIAVPQKPRQGGFILQAGAFGIEQNARALQEKVKAVLPNTYVDQSGALFRVRTGPFNTRAEAIDARETLEAAGLSGIVLAAE